MNEHIPIARAENQRFTPVVAIANVKGGVGKSTIILMLTEALAHFENLRVLVIDSDPQTSASIMLAPSSHLDYLSHSQKTLPDYLMNADEITGPQGYDSYIRGGVSDIRDIHTISLIPSDIRLALLEKELTRHRDSGEEYMNDAIGRLLNHARQNFDIILVDCPAGLSLLNDTWLQTTDFYLAPVKPDYLSVLAMNILDQSIDIAISRGQRIAKRLGVAINMKPPILTEYDRKWVNTIASDPNYNAFPVHIPLSPIIRESTEFSLTPRTYDEKYPGDLGVLAELFMSSFVERVYAPVAAG